MIRNEPVIATILDNGGIREGAQVLDVACGTGVLFPDYLARGASVTGIDISPEMVKIARSKFPQVEVLLGDVEETVFDRKFDAVMVYNAFPHFPNPAALIRTLAGLVKPGGRLSVAHGMSRAALQSHHAGRASQVSIDPIHEEDLKALMEPWFEVDTVISTGEMYQVAGTRLEQERHIHSHGGHSHTHAHGHLDHNHDIAPMDELLALMKYMVSHNDAHAQEMADLAQQLRDMGKTRAYQKIMDAVADFDVLNAKFDGILKELQADM
jgi:demethylmenaquinone methyltransferase/2-methoxy-6-polyprenyl-1,4-benzoquinol methylase